ncbi:MAG: DUF4296 domain-containing protein [Muribaculum sp.]|nr:DUF4296 domain-containing protein [Muribaculum sp.]
MSALMLATLTVSCDKTPDYVIKSDDMVELLVDIHKGESILELNRSKYANDSTRKVMKQSIFQRHGVTQEQFDTSLVWYGHNIEKYIEVYDKVIEELEGEIKLADVSSDGSRVQMAVVGDSVDAWPDVRFRHFAYGEPSDILKFHLKRDENWEKGDVYTWRFYVRKRISPINWTLAADYNDGTSDYIFGSVASEGWNEVKFVTDSSKVTSNMYGTIMLQPETIESAYVDSITLVRTRLNPSEYLRSNVKTALHGKKPKN